ncbi:hypothetical protein ACWDRB_57340 [Nonomuraea sp. NPDC003707]
MHRADVAIMSPYQEDKVRRFGDYIYDLNGPLEGMEVQLDLGRRRPETGLPPRTGRLAPVSGAVPGGPTVEAEGVTVAVGVDAGADVGDGRRRAGR